MVVFMTLLLQHLEQARAVQARTVRVARHVHHPVEGHAGLDRGVGVLEPGLVRRVAGAEREQRAQVPAGRAPADRDERGVAAVLGDVLLDPRHRPLGVDDVVGPGRLGAQAVVDGDAHPTAGHQLVHHGLALLALVADDPRAAVYVHHDRGGRGVAGLQLRAVDVEAVPAQPVAGVVDVVDDVDRPRLERDGAGDPPPFAPRRIDRVVGHGEGLRADLVERAGDDGGRPYAGHPEAEEAEPLDDGEREPEVARPSVESPEFDEQGRGDHLPDDVLECELSCYPGEREREDGERLPPDGPVGHEHGDGADEGDGEEGVRHGFHSRPCMRGGESMPGWRMPGWRDGGMAGWRDGGMAGWRKLPPGGA